VCAGYHIGCLRLPPDPQVMIAKGGVVDKSEVFAPTVATHPSAGGRREGSGVRLPRVENVRSRHQHLFERCIYARGRY